MEIKVLESENQVYSKQKLLGQGAFGKAYLVRKKQTGQLLVIKQMNIQHMSKSQKEQTVKEAQILRSMSHPNIVKFHQVYLTKQNKLKIVMEYAQNGDLSKAIHTRKNNKKYFEQEQILDWFTQVCLAIKHVHDRKILHRDIKGQNIFIGANNTLKLGDFGIARILNKTMDKARTVVGTPYYLSPEIIQNKPYSFKSDIWSMGVVLYQLCALTHPFTANSLQFLALKIVKGSYTPLQSSYSKELKSLVGQMLQLDPSKRPSVNQILKKPLILTRIKNFLTETKRQIEFSHTVLHNQKVQISNKLVQIANNGKNDPSKLQEERIKLKQRQAQIQKQMLVKKEAQRRASQQKRDKQKAIRQKQRQNENNKRLDQAKKRQQQQKKRMIAYQQQKKQQMQRQYDQRMKMAQVYQNRQAQQRRQQQLYKQKQRLMQQKYQIQEQKRKQKQQIKMQIKKLQKQQKQQQFKEAARRQYFENLQIKRRAQQRARKQQMGQFYDHPPSAIIQSPSNQEKYDYQNQKRPSSRGNQRPSSRNRIQKPNSRDRIQRQINLLKQNQQPQRVNKDISQEELQNVFMNPQFKQKSKQDSSNRCEIRPPSSGSNKKIQNNIQSDKKQEAQRKYEDARQKMRQDRQKYINNMKNINNQPCYLPQQEQTQISEDKNYDIPTIKGAKWQKRPQSSSKKQTQIYNSPKKEVNQEIQEDSPRFGNTDKQDDQSGSVIRESSNLFIQIKDQGQFDKYLQQLQNLVGNVNKKVDALADIPYAQQVIFRDEDTQQLQFSLTNPISPASQTLIKMSQQPADFDYFSDYSKLQTLRIKLQEAFGTDIFISIYRTIEKQIQDKGLQGFDMTQVITKVEKLGVQPHIIMQNMSLLLTLVAMQDKMCY